MEQILIICPLEMEVRFILKGFSDLGHEIQKVEGLKVPVFQILGKNLLVARGGHGKTQFGIQTQYLIANMKDLRAVICAGAGGGLATHLKVGDIVIAEKTIEHDYTEKFDPKAKLPEFPAHPELIGGFRNRQFPFPFNVHFGSVAGGDEDIVDPSRAEELHLSTQSLAVAWEGTGGARASKFNGIPFLELRAITDNARDSVAASFAKNLESCMKNVAQLVNDVF